jgi:hypothetical protein
VPYPNRSQVKPIAKIGVAMRATIMGTHLKRIVVSGGRSCVSEWIAISKSSRRDESNCRLSVPKLG